MMDALNGRKDAGKQGELRGRRNGCGEPRIVD